ncbi:putative MFS family arabinose efflux permease [Halopolyspora algeriensis]|uniref:Putative MFS family arabinose efflux permease n=1 Tax=Halopolyspora algeriensis TaxID=1500506 RepID=A0A368VMS3_9ACTN|nr:MFS transporter [Halopolyspora algeriensis]RCW41003.1 putative MFS family arabinose efflux permease [Halopolyspora algeriensis]TQM53913.1 putative MFS family arabinose efflux permease [Halopolyspora algeriensis]
MSADRVRTERTGRFGSGGGSFGAAVGAIAATTCGLLGVFLTSALAPLLRDDGIVTPAGLGIATAVFFGVSAVIAPLGGRLADRFGSLRVIRVALMVAAAALLAVATVVQGWQGLAVALGCAGATNGAIQPSTNRYVSRLVSPQRQGLAFGVKQAAIPMAILLGGLAVPAAAYVSGWRSIYYVGVACALGVALTLRAPSSGGHGSTPPATTAAATPEHTANPLPRAALIVLASGWGLASAGANALGAFFVLGAVHAGFLTVTAGLLAVLGSLSSISARIGMGMLADKRSGTNLGVVAAMSAVGAVSVALLATGREWSFLFAAVIGYGIGWGWAGLFNYAIVRTSPNRPGSTTGITQAGAGTGACLGPLAFGAMLGHTGYPTAWMTAGLTLLLASGIILTGRRMLPARP